MRDLVTPHLLSSVAKQLRTALCVAGGDKFQRGRLLRLRHLVPVREAAELSLFAAQSLNVSRIRFLESM